MINSQDSSKLYIKELNLDILQPNTSTFTNPEQGGSKHVVIGKPGCFAPGTKVLMYNGDIKNVEDVKQGEKVMGDDSKERNVIELCHNFDKMYRIIPNKGESVIVNSNHILSLKYFINKNNNNDYKIIDITVNDFLKKNKFFQKKCKWFRTAVSFPEKNTEIDPYDFGVWVSSNCENIDSLNKKNVEKNKYLQDNNLYEHKFIPKEFKINSKKNRLKLLAGIIDNLGVYDINGNGIEINHKEEKFIDDIVFLSGSLGYNSYKKKYIKNVSNKVESYYKCYIYGNNLKIIPSKLEPNIYNVVNTRDNLVTNFRIELVGDGEYFGFTLDGNNRFLLSDFSVVHNTGKSTLIASLLYAKKNIYPCGIVFSGTEDSNGFYKRMFPSTFIYNSYDEEQLKTFIKRQKIAKQHVKNPWAVCLLDDCTDTPTIFSKPLQQGIYKNSRHWKMWYILSLQYCMDVKPVIRTNVDGTFILREPNLKNRRSLWENYAGIIPDFTQFCDIMDQITNDYTALYIHNATKSNKLEDCLFWYKAKPVPSGFKFGCPDFWDFHYSRYNPDYVEPFLS